MAAEKIGGYDPSWQSKYDDQYALGMALWQRAVEEMHEFGAMRPETREAWINSLKLRKTIRKRAFATTADVARKMFNVLACRAFLAGHKIETPPDADDFNSLREIREYFTEQMTHIKTVRERNAKRPALQSLPVLPADEPVFFSEALEAARRAKKEQQDQHLMKLFGPGVMAEGIFIRLENDSRHNLRQAQLNEVFAAIAEGRDQTRDGPNVYVDPRPDDEGRLTTQAFYIPDVDDGFAVIVTTQKLGDERFICLSGKSPPARFRQFMPQLAAKLAERLFEDEDRDQMHFYVHHPLGHSENGHEQYWKYDLRPDARGAFQIAARQPMPAIPYAIANKQFVDQLPQEETSILDLDQYWSYQARILAQLNKQERISRSVSASQARKAARQLGASRKTEGLTLQ